MRVPAPYPERFRGGVLALIAHGLKVPATFRRASGCARSIFGARLADSQVELPAMFELNPELSSTQALGIEIPPTLLAHADDVIE